MLSFLYFPTAIASFQPKQKGNYKVEVTQDGKAIKGSPFGITVNEHHVCSASKVHAKGSTSDAVANAWNDIHLDTSQAG